jgi:hypothetical protein
MKVLVILLFFSGLFGMVRFFTHPDMSYVAMVLALSAFSGGIFMLYFILRAERRMSKKYKHLGINFWDPWQDIDD